MIECIDLDLAVIFRTIRVKAKIFVRYVIKRYVCILKTLKRVTLKDFKMPFFVKKNLLNAPVTLIFCLTFEGNYMSGDKLIRIMRLTSGQRIRGGIGSAVV